MPLEKNQAFNKENKKSIWSQEEKELSGSLYGCEILLEKCSLEDTKNKNLPSDTYIVSYYCDEQVCCDLTRSGKMSNIFDMYWDKIDNNLISITYGNGAISPRNWGYQSPKNKKRK